MLGVSRNGEPHANQGQPDMLKVAGNRRLKGTVPQHRSRVCQEMQSLMQTKTNLLCRLWEETNVLSTRPGAKHPCHVWRKLQCFSWEPETTDNASNGSKKRRLLYESGPTNNANYGSRKEGFSCNPGANQGDKHGQFKRTD